MEEQKIDKMKTEISELKERLQTLENMIASFMKKDPDKLARQLIKNNPL